ncbi:Double-strand break repair protein mre11a [Apophysomyces ossiformis]|uniref:Double-strand break repair protein n=1 Tax=Apophysomyces ossiformis TaxID=679940 RepID=A0A8H7BW11_9FUNG|nr:Double-strand break repair protein mre11a [Apophysomyces ossiformis]
MTDPNTLSILVATDNHIGYLEKDPVRGSDSFNSFEEILQLAQQHQVDMILLGGDLFHHNRPSLTTLYHTMRLIRKYCHGDKPSQLLIASDQSLNFDDEFNTANFLDPNMNISYPIFSIHGNHDDPAGVGSMSALSVLQVSGLVNYFGKNGNQQDITLYPILLQKGTTRLALYGLGNVRDERLHRTWRDGHVTCVRPVDESWRDTFNMFVLHQNRVKHGLTSYIPEEFIDEFFNLVVWGHEHECRIDPEPRSNTHITQPGSSVATSLSEGEAVRKHVGLIKITGRNYRLEKIPLRTVRPFQFTTVSLSEVRDVSLTNPKECQEYLASVVEDLINRAKTEWELECDLHSSQGIQPMPLCLVRVRVDYSGGFETFNTRQFGQRFTDRVANPDDIIQFQRRRATMRNTARSATGSNAADLIAAIPERLDGYKVDDVVAQIIGNELSMLSENELGNALEKFVEKGDQDSINDLVDRSLDSVLRTMMVRLPEFPEEISDDILKRRIATIKEERSEAYNREQAGKRRLGDDSTNASNKRTHVQDNRQETGSDLSVVAESSTNITHSRGRPKGRARGRARGRGRGGRPSITAMGDDDLFDDCFS